MTRSNNTSRVTRTPNLFLIGASKCSTTTLYKALHYHPQIWLPQKKGVYFFNSVEYGSPGAWEAYLKLFANVPPDMPVVGEASNTYTHQPKCGPVAERIKKQLDDPKFIYIVRDPVTRAVSHFRHKCLESGSAYATSLSEALETDELLGSVSSYAKQLEPYHMMFGEDRVQVIVAEQLHREPVSVMRQIEKFLQLDPFDWQDKHMSRSNTFEELKQSVGWQKLLGCGLYQKLRSITPETLRQMVKPMAPKVPDPPAISPTEEQALFDQISDDLKKMIKMLGDQVDVWPSVQKLNRVGSPT